MREGGREGGSEGGREGEKRETHIHPFIHNHSHCNYSYTKSLSYSLTDRFTIQLTEHNPGSYNVDSKHAKHGAGDACKGRVQTVKVDVFG